MGERITRATLGLLASALIIGPSAAQAGIQLFTAEWYIKSFGNECGGMGTTGPHCTGTTGASANYSAWGIPQGIQCNHAWPRCSFQSTPTGGAGSFNALGGYPTATYCAPWSNWQGYGTTMRADKGKTATTGKGRPTPPLYRNYGFFTASTPSAAPAVTFCAATSTGYTTQNKTRFGGNRGKVMQGNPITGMWSAVTTGTQLGGFNFAAAPAAAGAAGVRATGQLGDFQHGQYTTDFRYRYTYATLRNDSGIFAPSGGPGNFNIQYTQAAQTVASINVKQGAAKFGGTMRMLGTLTSKVCHYRNGGCALGSNNWRYDAVGATAYTMNGVVTGGYITTYKAYYYHTVLMQQSTVTVLGSRFPWTTGSVTVTATGRGQHKTAHYARGFDNRNTTTSNGTGTIQLVSPVLTRWLSPALSHETAGIAILRINFFGSAPDFDGDGVADANDNCSEASNPGQDDTDQDYCGNLCDADYRNTGLVNFTDFGDFAGAFQTNDEEKCHDEPIPGCTVGFPDWGYFLNAFFTVPGPSGTTPGTTACP